MPGTSVASNPGSASVYNLVDEQIELAASGVISYCYRRSSALASARTKFRPRGRGQLIRRGTPADVASLRGAVFANVCD